MSQDKQPSPHVGLFVTCLVDLFRPEIAFACIKLLENAHCTIAVPSQQTCCGQPAYNNGDRSDTIHIAKQMIQLFESYDYVVVPSGSCAGMIRVHYPRLFLEDKDFLDRAMHLAMRTYELTAFLVDVLHVSEVNAEYQQTITYHDACSGLRELGVYAQPRKLLASVKGLCLHELADSNVCCGFGGTFCVKYPAISNKMVSEKVASVKASGAATLLSGDLGCLMNMAGKLHREGSTMKLFHIAEVLANMKEHPGIGDGTKAHEKQPI